MTHYYPIYLNLKNRLCVVVGGGEVAERKVKSLVACDARVLVISPELNQELQELYQKGLIRYRRGNFSREDLSEACLIIGATDSRQTNSEIAEQARKQGILVNIVDSPEECDFIVPATVERGDLLIGISTGGKSPALARNIREELEERYGEEYAEFLNLMGELREVLKKEMPDQQQRERIFQALIVSDIIQLIKVGQKGQGRKRAQEIIEKACGGRK